MKLKTIFAASFLTFFMTNTFAQTSELKWQSSPIIIDGNEEDWNPTGGNLRFYDSKNELFYDLRNDSVNLYILVKSDNPFLRHQISRAGMKLKLNIQEKTKRTVSFTIEPKKGMPERTFSQTNRPGYLDELSRKEESLPKDTAYLQGFQSSTSSVISGTYNPGNICFDLSKGRRAEKTIFELQIPLRELFGNNYQLNQFNKIPLQIQFTINAMSFNSSFGQMHGGMGHGSGFGGGGRMRGDRMGDGMNPSEEGNEGSMQGYRNGNQPFGNFSNEKKDLKLNFYLTNKISQ